MNKRIIFFICLITIILSAGFVSAAENADQTITGDTSNLDANGDILAISSSENGIPGADESGALGESDKIPTEITVANTTLNMNPLDISAINATLSPSDAGTLKYNTSNSSVATVLLGGIVAVGEGNAKVTVYFEGNDNYAPCEKIIDVTVAKIPTEITVKNTAIEMAPFDIASAGANLTPGLALTLSYISSNTSVASVVLGEIIAVGEGEATITVSFNGNVRYAAAENKTIDVTVKKIPTEITVENTKLNLAPLDITPTGANLTNGASSLLLNYVSSNSSVARVVLGEIVAVSEGEATITVSFNGTARYEAAPENKTIDVTVKKIPTEITVENTTLNLAPLDITPTGANLTNGASSLLLNYVSSNSSVARVVLGEIVAVSEGEATITVSFNGTARYEAAPENKTIDVTVKKIPTEITVEKTTIEMPVFNIVPAGANLTNNGPNLLLNYVSSNSSVANVILGEIVSLRKGETIITVSFNGSARYEAAPENKTIHVYVKEIPTEITVENTTLNLAPFDVVPSGANLTNASNLLLNYTSSNSSVATVIFGEIVALSEGEATITVSFNGTEMYAPAESKTIDVTVKKIPTEITVEKTTIEMAPLDIVPSGANLTNASNLLLNYTSSNPSVATVILGEIVAVGEGEATITVSFNGTARYAAAESKTIDVTVNKIPTEITVEKTTIEMAPLDIVSSGANLTNGPALLLNYTSSNSSVATVVLGQIVAVGEGEATITVSFNGTARYAAAESKTIDVTVKKIPTEITIENATFDLKVIQAVPTGANLTNASSILLNYTSSNSSVANVVLGEIVTLSKGEAIITVSFDGNVRYEAAESKTITVNVSLWDASVSVDNDTLELIIEDTYTINATTDPEILKYISLNFTSSDESVATVDENGTVTAVGPGTATITVTVGRGIIYVVNSTDVTVIVDKNSFEPNITSEGETLTVEVPENATGSITLLIGNETLVAPIKDGVATFDLSDVPGGDYNATVIYDGDDKYNGFETVYPVSLEDDFIITAEDVVKYYGGSERFAAYITDGKGKPIVGANVSITVNGQKYDRTTDQNGRVTIGINLVAGEYPVEVSYNGTTVDAKVTVLTTINSNDLVKVFRNATQYYATFLDSEGNFVKEGTAVRFNIHGVFYDRNVGKNGLAKLNINLEPGKYIITAYNLVTGEEKAYNITVLSRITETKDITKYYRNGTQYTAKIIGDDGKAVGKGETVTFNINGVFYERQTDENGIVQLNLNLEPKDYIITAVYKECMVANNIKILPVLSAEDLTKKYGTQDPFVANLVDGQGKPYANQKIEFNINGVFYYRTTDSAGQAKLNINLMAGQYIITSGYNGSYIANKVTITA